MSTALPFGVLVPGQLPCSAFVPVGPCQWKGDLPGGRAKNFLLYLTGAEPLPAGCGMSVYLSEPRASSANGPPGGGEAFTFLGALSNDCPSALFEVPAAFLAGGASATAAASSPPPLELGVALEPAESIANLLQSSDTSAGTASASGLSAGCGAAAGAPSPIYRSNNATRLSLGQSILGAFSDFVCSFAKTVDAATLPIVLGSLLQDSPSGGAGPATEYVIMPMNFFEQWRAREERKLKAAIA